MRTNVTGIILSLFPTYVGVILVLIAAFKLHKAFPHTRGGDPTPYFSYKVLERK
jgi:hypothetical protein